MKLAFNEDDVVFCPTFETFGYSLGATIDVPAKFTTAPITNASLNELRQYLPSRVGIVSGRESGVYLVYCCAGKLYVYLLRKEESNGEQEIG